MNVWRSILSSIILIAFLLIRTEAQSIYVHEYSLGEGFPYSTVLDIEQTEEGQLLISTVENGILSYDGNHFNAHQLNNLMNGDIARRIYRSGDEYWLSVEEGLYHTRLGALDDARFYPLNVFVNVIYQEESGSCLFGTDKGLYYFSNGQIQPSQNEVVQNLPIRSIQEHKGQIVLGTNRGILTYERGKINFLTHQNISAHQMVSISAQGLWYTDNNANLYKYTDSGIHSIHPSIIGNSRIINIFKSPENELYISNNKGQLYKSVNNSSNSSLEIKPIYAGIKPQNVLVDQFHNIWFNQTNGKLFHFEESPFSRFAKENSLKQENISKLFRDQEGRIWFLGSGPGVEVLVGDRILHHDASSGFTNASVINMTQDPMGIIWFLTGNKELFNFDGEQFSRIIIQNVAHLNFSQLVAGNDNHIYLSTRKKGIYSFKPGRNANKTWRKVQNLANNKEANAQYFFPDQAKIWYWSYADFGFIEDGKIVSLKELKHFRHTVNAISKIGSSYLLSTRSSGLFWLNETNREWKLEKLKSNSYPDPIVDIIPVNDSKVFIISSQTIYFCEKNGKRLDKLKSYHLDKNLRDAVIIPNSFIPINEESVLFTSSNGIHHLNLQSNLSLQAPSRVQIKLEIPDLDTFETIGSKSLISESFEFTPDVKSLEMSFSSIHLSGSNKVLYQWRLIGSDSIWSAPSKEHHLVLNDLKPGNYRFDVRSCFHGQCNKPTQFYFQIQSPFWSLQKKVLLLFTTLLLTFFTLLLIQSRRHEKKSIRLKTEWLAEKKQLKLEQQVLQMQMNPHFLFNALNAIKSEIHEDSIVKARYHLSKFSKMVRQVLQNSRKEYISLQAEIKLLSDFMDLHQLIQKKPFKYAFKVDEGIDLSSTLIPPMIIQPFVENAIIHGIRNIADGYIQIHVIKKGAFLEIQIRDNGSGMDSFKSKSDHESLSFTISKQRLRMLNQDKRKSAPIRVEKNDDKGGTKIIIYLPWKESKHGLD